MDYSIPHDPENPSGTSPWASSPQHSRISSFANTSTSDVLSSPLPDQSPYADSSPEESYHRDQDSYGQSSISERAGENGSSQYRQSEHTQHQQKPVPITGQQPQNQQRQEPQRQQSGRPRQSAPQHKLQAKITGLERTSKKDPILKFDVYVSLLKFLMLQQIDVAISDQPAEVSNYTIP